MTPDLLKAAALSLVVHTGLLWGMGGPTDQVVVDVERDLVSVELELFSPSQLVEPDEVPPITPPPPAELAWAEEPTPPPLQPDRSVEVVAGHGAFTDATPRAIRNRAPAYPFRARLRGWEGIVVLQVRVDPDGHPSRVQIITSSGYAALDRVAQSAIQQWEFVPATRDGRSVRSEVELPVRFRLTAKGAME